jgi:2'-5' RNA ligase
VRLFVALEIPPDVRANLADFIKEMNALSEQFGQKWVRWVRAANLHITLKFIGEVADTKLDGIRGALAKVRGDGLFEIRIRGMGFFPDEERTTVLWTGLEASAKLASLAGAIDAAIATQGLRRENRAFLPHLTLARFAPPGILGSTGIGKELLAAIKQNGEREFGSFVAREFHLVESKLKPSGAEYTTRHSFPFVAEA